MIRELGPDDLPWLRALLDEHWGGQVQIGGVRAFSRAEQAGVQDANARSRRGSGHRSRNVRDLRPSIPRRLRDIRSANS